MTPKLLFHTDLRKTSFDCNEFLQYVMLLHSITVLQWLGLHKPVTIQLHLACASVVLRKQDSTPYVNLEKTKQRKRGGERTGKERKGKREKSTT